VSEKQIQRKKMNTVKKLAPVSSMYCLTLPTSHGNEISRNKSRWLVLTSIYTSVAHSTYLEHEYLVLGSPEVFDPRTSK
jgi:hypothetical protein